MLGERLRHNVEQLIAKYSARLRTDPLTPMAKRLLPALIEDHAMSYFGDLFQSLVILEKSDDLEGREESDLMNDGSQIQRLIAELHGRQRHRLGWTEEALHREYQIIDEEVESLLRQHSSGSDRNRLEWALGVLKRMLNAAHDASFAAFHAAEKDAAGTAR